MASGIYEIVNLSSGKRYVGSAVDIKDRCYGHKRELRKGKHKNRYLQRAWNKAEKRRFVFKTLLFCSKSDLIMYEQIALDALKPEYNLARVAGKNSFLGLKHTAKTKKKMSKAAKVRPISRGWKRSPEVIELVAAMHRGRKRPAETREKISKAKRGKPNPHSEAHKEAIRAVYRARGGKPTCTPEAIARMAETKRASWAERKQIIAVRDALRKLMLQKRKLRKVRPWI